MLWSWHRPATITVMAAPLVFMWGSVRSFLTSAVVKVPAAARSALVRNTPRPREQRRASVAKGRRLLCSAGGRVEALTEDLPRKVIIITGPTAVGKSRIALSLCERIGGEIVSCDSVQVYNDLNVGSNKPSEEDMKRVRHHLVNIASLSETFSAGEFVRRAYNAINDIHSRGLVPVVVGGTMMYIQWLVDGKPDAPKRIPTVIRAVESELLPFRERGDWDGALQILADVDRDRADSLGRNDWYRLLRALEVVRSVQDGEMSHTGQLRPLQPTYDFRPFFVFGDRERLFRRIDNRCMRILERGLLVETANLLMKGTLHSSSSAGRAIGYRQAIEFLSQASRENNGECELLPAPALTISDVDAGDDTEARIVNFCQTYAAVTRKYARYQIKWFRSTKGRKFSWQAWDLGGDSVTICPSKNIGGSRRTAQPARHRDVAVTGDGRSSEDVVSSIADSVQLSAEAFAEDLHGEHQAALRRDSMKRGQQMKYYETIISASSLSHHNMLECLVPQANELSTRVRSANAKLTTEFE